MQEGYERSDSIMEDYNMGLITNNERYNQIIDVWTNKMCIRDRPGSYQRRSAFRNPRGWPYGRCRSDPEDREIIFTTYREAVFRTASRF